MRESIGRYLRGKLLGKGSMGLVYEAYDPMIKRKVAVKTVRKDRLDEGAVDAFLHEARTSGRLKAPNIVTIFDLGIHEDAPYMVMELVDGRSLVDYLKAGPLKPAATLGILVQVARALDYAHAHQVIHRDIKPENIMVTSEGKVKILDFGIARLFRKGDMTAESYEGTPGFSSPEQLTGRPIDHRADLFSLGVLSHLLLTRKMPFPGTKISAVAARIIKGTPSLTPVPGDLGLDPGQLQAHFQRALHSNIASRFNRAGDQIASLLACFAAVGIGPDEVLAPLPQNDLVSGSEALHARGDLKKALAGYLKNIQGALHNGNFNEAGQMLDEARLRLGNLTHLARMELLISKQRMAEEKRELDRLIKAVKQHLANHHFELAYRRLLKGSREFPGNLRIMHLLDQTEKALQEATRCRQRKAAIARVARIIRRYLKEGSLGKAERLFHNATARYGEEGDLAPLAPQLRQAQEQRLLADLLEQVYAHIGAKRFEDAFEILGKAAIVAPQHPALARTRAFFKQQLSQTVRDRSAAVAVGL